MVDSRFTIVISGEVTICEHIFACSFGMHGGLLGDECVAATADSRCLLLFCIVRSPVYFPNDFAFLVVTNYLANQYLVANIDIFGDFCFVVSLVFGIRSLFAHHWVIMSLEC